MKLILSFAYRGIESKTFSSKICPVILIANRLCIDLRKCYCIKYATFILGTIVSIITFHSQKIIHIIQRATHKSNQHALLFTINNNNNAMCVMLS